MNEYTGNLCIGGFPTASGGNSANLTDNNMSTTWYRQSPIFPQWVQYTFTKEERVNRVGILSYYYAGYESIKDIRIFGSKTGAFSGEQVLLYTGTHPENKSTMHYHEFENGVRYKYIRVMIDSIYYGNGNNDTIIHEMQMFGLLDTNKILIRKFDGFYVYLGQGGEWKTLLNEPTVQDFKAYGMNEITDSQLQDFESVYGNQYRILRWTDGEPAKNVKLKAIPQPTLTLPTSDIPLFGINELKSVNVTATGGGRIAISVDGGVTWNKLNNNTWNAITDIADGMTFAEFNAITSQQLQTLKGDSNTIRFAYYLTGNTTVDKIELRVSINGTPQFANKNDYDMSYDANTKTITYNIKKSGHYVVNYINS